MPRLRPAYSVKSSRVISATEAARAFSELLDRVSHRGETFLIERGGKPVCEMSHVKPLRFTGTDFLTLLHSLPKPDPGFWHVVEDATRRAPTLPESPWERSVLIACYAEEDFAISAITASELLHGVHRAAIPAERRRREAFVEGLLARLPIISFDTVTARIHARLSAELAGKGTVVGPHDLIIAATVMSKGYVLATPDERSFAKIPGLTLLRW